MVEYINKGKSPSKSTAPNQNPVPLQKGESASSGNVTVVCRFRPFNESELEMGAKPIVNFNENKKNVTINVEVSAPCCKRLKICNAGTIIRR